MIINKKQISVLMILYIGIMGCQIQQQIEPIELAELTIAEIHKAYEAGSFNSQQLVSAYLARIHELDSEINALTTINPNALSIAKELDKEYERTKVLRPLHGIPLIVKDNINTKGLPTTGGSFALRDFVPDVEAYLATYVRRDTMKSLEDIIRTGTTSQFSEKRLKYFARFQGRSENPEIECLDAYNDANRIAFREAIENRMDSLKLDAIIYPSWNNRPARIEFFEEEYKGDNSQIISPHTGQPAFTVPMGYSESNLPAGLQFLGRMYDEPTLIMLAYSYEQGTKHRTPPIIKK